MKILKIKFDIIDVVILCLAAFAVGCIIGRYVCHKESFSQSKPPQFDPFRNCGGIIEFDATEEWRVTAYCPCEECCGRFSDGITASGHIIQAGDKFVAAPCKYPFGTIIDIPGYGKVPVLDRGGAIKGDRLDVFFPDHETALEWGIKYLPIKLQDGAINTATEGY